MNNISEANGLKIQWSIVSTNSATTKEVRMPLSNLDKSLTIAYAGAYDGELNNISYATCREYSVYDKNLVKLWGIVNRRNVYVFAIGY